MRRLVAADGMSATEGPPLGTARDGHTAVDLDDVRVAPMGTLRFKHFAVVLAAAGALGSFATLNRVGSGDLLVVGGYDSRVRLLRRVLLVPASTIGERRAG